MADTLSKTARRLSQVRNMMMGLTQDPNDIPWNPDSTTFPLRQDLPKAPGAPEDAAWVWGKEDFRGRLNLLTATRVKAASAEIRTGEVARLDLPLNVPQTPAFGREKFKHEKKTLTAGVSYDDIYTLNTQSGTQWDGFRHFSHIPTQIFYNSTKPSDFAGENDNGKCSIHHWSAGGFSGRGILLDYRSYAESQGIKYDSCARHAISYSDLEACGKYQGLDIRPASQGGDIKIGDILLIRSGWTQDYYQRSEGENETIALRGRDSEHGEIKYAGVKQEQAMIDWLHNCYFSAVAGDAPAFEAWPTAEKYFLHEYLLALWGVPIGEMLDLEKVSELAKKNKRWTFFFSSAPNNCPGGVSSHVNGTAIF